MRNDEKLETGCLFGAIVLWLGAILLFLGFWATVIFIVIHFVHKVW